VTEPAPPAPTPTLRGNVRAMPRTIWVLLAGTFINRFGTFVLPFLVLYLRDRGYSAPQGGIAVAMYGVGGIAAVGIGGLLADRIGRRNSVALSMFGSAVATLALSQAHTLGTILPLTALVGLFAESYRPAASALIADHVPSERRVTAFALNRLAVNLGWAFGPALGGVMASRSFFILFAADAATSAVYGIIALVALPHGVRSAREDERRGEATRSVLADRGFLVFLAATFFMAVVYMQTATTFALQVRTQGFSNETYGLLLSLNGLIVVVFELPLSAFTQRHPATRMVAIGAFLVGVGFLLVGWSTTLIALAGCTVIFTFGEILGAPQAAMFVADRSPQHLRGRYQAAFGTMFGLAAVVGPIAGTAAFHRRPILLWVGCGVLGSLAAGLALAAGRRPVPDLALEGLPR
jgi:MFS family permease